MSDETPAAENTSQAAAAPQQPPASPSAEQQSAAPVTEATAPAAQPTTQPQAQPEDDSLLTGKEETKTFDEPKEGEKPAEAKPEESIFGAPEAYKFEEFPEGTEAVGASGFIAAAKEMNLNNKTAQAFLSKSIAGLQADRAKERAALRQDTLSDAALNWRNPAVQQQANSAYQKYFGGSPRIQAKLKALNLDVDREFLGIMQRLGGEMSQGSFVQGSKQGSDEMDFRRMYPATRMNR